MEEYGQDSSMCSECLTESCEDGEGYDGMCGNCADIAEREEEE